MCFFCVSGLFCSTQLKKIFHVVECNSCSFFVLPSASLYKYTQFVLCEYIQFIFSSLRDIWGVQLYFSDNKAIMNSHS